jgi:hypothetical protein
MLSEAQEIIWPPCGSGEAFGDAFAAGAAADVAFALERVLNIIMKTRTMIASGANAIAENRIAGSFIGDLASVDLELRNRKRARSISEEDGRVAIERKSIEAS